MPATVPHPTPHKLPEFASVEEERLHRKQRLEREALPLFADQMACPYRVIRFQS